MLRRTVLEKGKRWLSFCSFSGDVLFFSPMFSLYNIWLSHVKSPSWEDVFTFFQVPGQQIQDYWSSFWVRKKRKKHVESIDPAFQLLEVDHDNGYASTMKHQHVAEFNQFNHPPFRSRNSWKEEHQYDSRGTDICDYT